MHGHMVFKNLVFNLDVFMRHSVQAIKQYFWMRECLIVFVKSNPMHTKS